MRRSGTVVVCLGLAAIAYGQESFEVASIKLHPGIINYSSDPSVKGNRVTSTASTLVDLITTAYRVRYDQISGAPNWAHSEHYDLDAKAGAEAITREQMRQMLQALLADRFQLRIHRETREVPMYALMMAKNGPKLKESSADEPAGGQITGDGTGMHMVVHKDTMAQLATRLSGNGAGRPVLDKTGLQGIYSFKLDWVNETPGVESDAQSLFQALQDQLGLRLESTKGPSEFIVIDSVQRPTAN